jgi:hypothetical protein
MPWLYFNFSNEILFPVYLTGTWGILIYKVRIICFNFSSFVKSVLWIQFLWNVYSPKSKSKPKPTTGGQCRKCKDLRLKCYLYFNVINKTSTFLKWSTFINHSCLWLDQIYRGFQSQSQCSVCFIRIACRWI